MWKKFLKVPFDTGTYSRASSPYTTTQMFNLLHEAIKIIDGVYRCLILESGRGQRGQQKQDTKNPESTRFIVGL